MSAGTIIYLGSMLAMFVAQRILDGEDSGQTGVTILAVAGLVVAAVLRFRELRAAREDGIRLGVARQYAGVNSNILSPGRLVDPLSNNAVVNGIEVEVAPAG